MFISVAHLFSTGIKCPVQFPVQRKIAYQSHIFRSCGSLTTDILRNLPQECKQIQRVLWAMAINLKSCLACTHVYTRMPAHTPLSTCSPTRIYTKTNISEAWITVNTSDTERKTSYLFGVEWEVIHWSNNYVSIHDAIPGWPGFSSSAMKLCVK